MYKQSFYFVRHGETDFNAKGILHDGQDAPLNEKGRLQARNLRPLLENLPIKTICRSPLMRVRETKELMLQDEIVVTETIIEELSECPGMTWQNIRAYEANPTCFSSDVVAFMHRIEKGLIKAFNQEGPLMIVAHGGVHWMICHLLNVQNYVRRIENCGLVHFYPNEEGSFSAKLLKMV